MFSIFKKNTIYIQIKLRHLSARHIESKTEILEKPLLALDNKRKILAFGNEAENFEGTEKVIDGFSHPRSFIADVIPAAELIKCFIQKLLIERRKSTYVKKPIVVFHPQVNINGGLTSFEIRGLRDIGELVKSSKTFVWVGRALTDEELGSLCFPETEGTLYKVKI